MPSERARVQHLSRSRRGRRSRPAARPGVDVELDVHVGDVSDRRVSGEPGADGRAVPDRRPQRQSCAAGEADRVARVIDPGVLFHHVDRDVGVALSAPSLTVTRTTYVPAETFTVPASVQSRVPGFVLDGGFPPAPAPGVNVRPLGRPGPKAPASFLNCVVAVSEDPRLSMSLPSPSPN